MVREITFVSLISIFSALLSGCAGVLNAGNPRQNADLIAAKRGFSKQLMKTQKLEFLTYRKKIIKSDVAEISQFNKENKIERNSELLSDLHIYIEGDGRSYITPTKVSPDPTPLNPLALKLALLDPHPRVVYLARPCQYTKEQNPLCKPELWTTDRFSEEVIATMNEAVSRIKKETHATKIHLIGFSGGAAVAVLLAARRQDIASVRTVAGDLDHERMSEFHRTTLLGKGALNPKHFAAQLAHIPQHHFVGDKDPIVPTYISEEFLQATPKSDLNHVHRTVLKGVSHHDGWEKLWPELLSNSM